MKRILLVLMALIACGTIGATLTVAADYNYITAEDLNDRLGADSPMIIIDICTVEQFAKGHIKGSIETNAYPVKSAEEKARLAEHLDTLKASTDDVVIVCPRGGGGAKNTFDFYRNNGVDVSRLLILKKGMEKWPFETESK
ncbi:MAG: rhodanese-like domain-containing protein [Desulforhopalus sp.]